MTQQRCLCLYDATDAGPGPGALPPNGATPETIEAQGKLPPVRGFGPGGRIPRDSATDIVSSPGGACSRRNSKGRSAAHEASSLTPTWRGSSSRNGEDDEAVSFAVKRPVFF